MSNAWNSQAAEYFWNGRISNLVVRDESLTEKREKALLEKVKREQTIEEEKRYFIDNNECRLGVEGSAASRRARKTADDLKFWIENSSWSYCPCCSSVTRQKLFPNFQKRPVGKKVGKCVCAEKRYIVPSMDKIPVVLKGLTHTEIFVLRPLDFHCGDYKREPHGYRRKNGMCRVTWCVKSVEEKIRELENEESKNRCEKAYEFLMGSSDSSYGIFVTKRLEHVARGVYLNLYNRDETKGIECCLWPNLYPFTDWCESVLSGKEDRLSQKIAFFRKVFSGILDYSLEYELLQYHYDIWIFKTVSGAIGSARRFKCSPARALNAKVFSSGYWKKQHRLLMDAVRQFGFPSVFVTISPYEWSFPWAVWMKNIREVTGRCPTKLAGFETVHYAHILEQVVRGYLCGSNTKTWTNHLFNYSGIRGRSNVLTYFYRFEFQQRGTVHIHLLVWLKNVSKIQHELVRGDIPYEDTEMAFLVQKLQPSDRGCLPLNNDVSNFAERNGPVHLFHPEEAFACKLRGYISSVLPALSCRMDFQLTDGRSMILRYVTSYVSKWRDAYSNDSLYSTHVSPYQAAYRHLQDLQPCEPEMWLYLSSMKFSWSQSRTKEYIVPLSQAIGKDKTHEKYMCRPSSIKTMSLLQWLRYVDHTSANVKVYKTGNTLVSVKMVSPFCDEYFFQYLVMNLAHELVTELYDPRHEQLPLHIRFFASARIAFPRLWQDREAIRTLFQKDGHRESYINTLCSHIFSLGDVLNMWQRQIFTSDQFKGRKDCLGELQLDDKQNSIVQGIMDAMCERDQFLNDLKCYEEEWDDDGSDDENKDDDENNVDVDYDYGLREEGQQLQFSKELESLRSCDWRKFTLISGKPGTGKSEVLKETINRCIQQDRKILVACPTGMLAGKYRNIFQESISSDTVHSAFNYPVNTSEQACVNWSIATFDLIIVDEVSMIAKKILEHVIRTISEVTMRPVVVFAGDERQQQPIETIEGRTIAVDSILQDKQFYKLVYHHKLSKQYRCVDLPYERFLDHIRHWQPSQKLLDSIQEGKVMCPESLPTDKEIIGVIVDHPDATFLTVSRRASARVNNVVISSIFADANPLGVVQCDFQMEAGPVYKNMRVIITQNRDKANNVVNGQEAIVHSIEKGTIFLELPNEKIVSVYPVTCRTDDGLFTCYPFTPAYSLTMCKSQGQTLKKIILWFDTNIVAPGTAYVALSRIRGSCDLIVITPILTQHAKPA